MIYRINDIVKYATGTPSNPQIVEAKVFAIYGNKLSLDHRTFSRARSVSMDSPKLLGLA